MYMYLIIIKTKYNVIRWEVEDITSPSVKEVLEQPYVEEVRIEQIKNKEKEKVLKNVGR